MSSSAPQTALALGIGSKNNKGEWLEAFFPHPIVDPSKEFIQALIPLSEQEGDTNFTVELYQEDINKLLSILVAFDQAKHMLDLAMQWLNSAQPVLISFTNLQEAPQTVPEVYLHLQLLSHRLVKPHEISLEGIFSKLPNIAWTNMGPVDLRELKDRQISARGAGKQLEVKLVDKFPPMLDYVIPSGVRIGDGARVRLGAYLGEGTTVMHEGFVNFNAGTLGASMVEGRISAGVVIGGGSDLGGGCSTMGTLSGGNKTIISLGENCLVGANAGVGIPLGDRCTIEAGLYLTAGSKVTLIDSKGKEAGQAKAMELSGKSDLLFRRNSQSGAIECLTNKTAIELNDELHKNN